MHITQFDGHNFPFWKFQLFLVLETRNLMGVLWAKSRPEQDVKTSNVEALEKWRIQDLDARNFLVATIEESVQRTLINCTTAAEMWTDLLHNIVQMLVAIEAFEYIEGHNGMQHITAIETMAI